MNPEVEFLHNWWKMKWVQRKCLPKLKKNREEKLISTEKRQKRKFRKDFPVKLILNLNFFCPVSTNDKQWPERPYLRQKYFWAHSNFTLSISLARKQAFAAPGLCFATRHVVHLCSPDKHKFGKKQRAGKKNQVPLEPWEETGLLSAYRRLKRHCELRKEAATEK